MTRKALLFVLFFMLVAFRVPAYSASSVSAAGGKSFAQAWNSYSSGEKKSFLFGLATAVRIMCTDASTLQKDAKPQEIEQHFRNCFNSYVGVEPGRLIDAMNSLYADPKNAMIPIDGAYKISLMRLRGDKVDEVIVQSRKYGERIQQEIDQQRKAGK
ncbi:conserved hypothetical protein [Solidesulfovibrio fructosivorans JJ]]|uniref:Uncharacterized protein n=1 Tax=Solidesulfovibrio fructosivorans JJ] TaxID=596151 RepID=E1K0H7_SOLFR|nr:hypothetical protein [Solidesulfovibrio fructosivorans]EFL49920.1 conserved hypothetical protein [Solidesulfovibrio fructosivorans JJ]]